MKSELLQAIERRQRGLALMWLRQWAKDWFVAHPETLDVEVTVDTDGFRATERVRRVYVHSHKVGSPARHWEVLAAAEVRERAAPLFFGKDVGSRWRLTRDGRLSTNKKARAAP